MILTIARQDNDQVVIAPQSVALGKRFHNQHDAARL